MPNTYAQSKARLLFDPSELAYDFGTGHPFQSRRLVALIDLLESSGLWHMSDEQNQLPFQAATLEELGLIHTPAYIATVQWLSTPLPDTASKDELEARERLAAAYGFGEGDTPAVPRLHEAAAQIAGGTLVALSAVMGLPEGGTCSSEHERPLHVFHPAGGLHHAWDPLSHLELTMRGIQAQMQLVHQLVHTYCHGRWVALGGGGYDLYRVVPRAWSMLWAEMSEQPLPKRLPEEWVMRWRPVWQAFEEQEQAAQQALGKAATLAYFPTTFQDRPEEVPAQLRRWSISRTNQRTVALVRQFLVPPSVRQAFPEARHQSPLAGMIDLLRIRGSATPSRSKTFETPKGPLFLRDFCSPSLVECLKAESGMRAFARLPEREHQLLLSIAKSPDSALTLAHTPAGEIVGEVTLAPGEAWFEGLEDAYEVAIEVSSHWRGLGLARALLAFALEFDTLEDIILFAMGLSWHWDMEGLGISIHRYRELISRLFASQGFVEYPTNEPNISMEPGNILLARIGKRVDQHVANRFVNRLLRSPNLARW